VVWLPTSLQLSGSRAAFSPGQNWQCHEDKHTPIDTRLGMSGAVPHYFSYFASCQIQKMSRQCTTWHLMTSHAFSYTLSYLTYDLRLTIQLLKFGELFHCSQNWVLAQVGPTSFFIWYVGTPTLHSIPQIIEIWGSLASPFILSVLANHYYPRMHSCDIVRYRSNREEPVGWMHSSMLFKWRNGAHFHLYCIIECIIPTVVFDTVR
jgi:hypothetical protein